MTIVIYLLIGHVPGVTDICSLKRPALALITDHPNPPSRPPLFLPPRLSALALYLSSSVRLSRLWESAGSDPGPRQEAATSGGRPSTNKHKGGGSSGWERAFGGSSVEMHSSHPLTSVAASTRTLGTAVQSWWPRGRGLGRWWDGAPPDPCWG